MNELVGEEAELEHVLAFLDEYCSQENRERQRAAECTHASGDTGGLSSKCSKRSLRLASKTRYRSRVKEEYSRLRSDIRLLETTLAQLKRSQFGSPVVLGGNMQSLPGSRVHECKQSMAEAVPREYKRRKQSETVNHELKALLASAQKACVTVSAAWDQILTKKNLAMLRSPHPIRDSIQRCWLPGQYQSAGSLSMRIERLALDTDWHFGRAGLKGSHSFSFCMKRVVDSSFDAAFDIAMSSHLSCSKEHAASSFLRAFVCDDEHVSRQKIEENDSKYIRKTLKSVRFGHQQYNMEGVCAIREVREADRVRIIWSTLLLLPSASTSIREDCIIAVETACLSPPACLLQIWYRVYAEPPSPNSAFQTDLENELLKESVLRSHCRTTGGFFQSVESNIANEAYNPRCVKS